MDFISIAAMRRAARGRALRWCEKIVVAVPGIAMGVNATRWCEKIVVAAPGIAMGVKPIATEMAGVYCSF